MSGVGIKAGGLTQSDMITGYRGGNVTVRYNTVYNIQNTGGGRLTGISTNKGASGKIYGNLVYNTGLYGIELDDPLDNTTSANWSVYNNTLVNAGKNGLKVYISLTGTESTSQIFIANNIADGGTNENDIEIGFASGLTKTDVNGKNNVLVNGRKSANYVGQNDKTASAASLFVNAGSNDYRLKAGAPAINAGSTSVSASLYSKDIRGYLLDGPLDIGSFEYGDKFLPPPPPATTSVWLEAECATSQGAIWEIKSGSSASSGQYAQVASGNYSASNAPDASGQLSFTFSVSQAGSYKLFTRHKSLNGFDDSYWLRVNNGSWGQQGVNSDVDAFVWEQTAGTLPLNSGTNTITIGYREPDFSLDKLFVTLTGSLPTGQGSAATNCGGGIRVADTSHDRSGEEDLLGKSATELLAYPNPADRSLTIYYPSGESTNIAWSLTDVAGHVVYRQTGPLSGAEQPLEIPTHQLPEGMYILRWHDERAPQITKVLVRH